MGPVVGSASTPAPASASATLGSRAYVPLSVAWLEQLSFSVSATKQHKRDVRYVLTTQHKPSLRRWAVSRSFDEYRDFQTTLARALRYGHRCDAQCPWLYTFVTSYFPKPSLFRSSSSEHVIRARCDALAEYLATLQSVLLSRANHSCRVLVKHVADVLLDFLCAGETDQFPVKQWAFAGQQHRARGSVESLTSTSEEDESFLSSSRSLRALCSADKDDDETVIMSQPSTCTSSSFMSMDSLSLLDSMEPATVERVRKSVCALCDVSMEAADGRMYYTTRLRCGHRFHDECAIQSLNSSMTCPTCSMPVGDDV